jgi:hypothetical protein
MDGWSSINGFEEEATDVSWSKIEIDRRYRQKLNPTLKAPMTASAANRQWGCKRDWWSSLDSKRGRIGSCCGEYFVVVDRNRLDRLGNPAREILQEMHTQYW